MYVVAAVFVAINVVTVAAYWLDKQRARHRWYRLRESHLLALAFVGGSPGAILGMWSFHHKTSKRQFRRSIYLIVFLQATLIVLWARLWG
ncbi:MAG: DUF1294 domain-containing protein [Chloroflexi bacterium]|nr:DUF1294 domain-containing protein [Chloroflexota bacterium]